MAMDARIATIIRMANDAQILTLSQWFSPAYPVGAFAYSHGLEAAVEAGQVTDAASLAGWLDNLVKYGAGASDLLFLAAAYRAENSTAVQGVDAMCRAFAPSRERLLESDLQGAAFCKVTAAVWAQDIAGLAYPVAAGRAAKLASLPLDLTAQMFLLAFASNLISCATRLIPLGQTKAQHMIHQVRPLVQEIAQTQLARSLDDLSGTAFAADIVAMKHEEQYARIFRT